MNAYYIDSSAAVKLYVNEPGSAWLNELLLVSHVPIVLSSELLRAELWSAFARRLREGSVDSAKYGRIHDAFREHRHEIYRFASIRDDIIRQACECIDRYPLRAADAIHLATAITLRQSLPDDVRTQLVFLCADDRLLAAAADEGFATENPNEHP